MLKESLFAAEEREAKLDQLGDVLQLLNAHVDFAAFAAEIDRAARREGWPSAVPHQGDGEVGWKKRTPKFSIRRRRW